MLGKNIFIGATNFDQALSLVPTSQHTLGDCGTGAKVSSAPPN
jgi:hypothetical protein